MREVESALAGFAVQEEPAAVTGVPFCNPGRWDLWGGAVGAVVGVADVRLRAGLAVRVGRVTATVTVVVVGIVLLLLLLWWALIAAAAVGLFLHEFADEVVEERHGGGV